MIERFECCWEPVDEYTERITDNGGTYLTRWPNGLASAPAFGVPFRVLRDEWHDDYTLRIIHEIKLV